MMALTVPFVMEIAMLSDQPPNSEGVVTSFDERGLIYIETIGIGQDEDELRDYFEGRTLDPDVLRENNINIDIDEIINRGVIPRDDGDLLYVTQRGSVSTRGYSGKGITALVLVDCPQDSRSRMAIWFAPDPSPDSPVDELELAGTPADEAELGRFMQQFRFCDSRADGSCRQWLTWACG